MNIEQLIVFNKIAALGTMRSAAEELHKSQPALSVSLKKLEEEIGFELFDRSLYRPQLTEKGNLFLQRSKGLLESFHDLESYARDLSGNHETHLRVAIDSAAPFEALLPRIQNCVSSYPTLELEFTFGVLTQCVDALLGGKVDIAIGPLLNSEENLESKILLSRLLICSVHKKHCIDGKEPSLKQLKNLPNIIVGSGRKESSVGVSKVKGGKKFHVSNHAVEEQLILAGVGWGRISEERLNESPYSDRLIALSHPELAPVKLDICLLWKKDKALGPIARKVKDDLSSFCRGNTQNQL